MRQKALILLAAILAAGIGLTASVALNGPGALLQSPIGQRLSRAAQPPGGAQIHIGDTMTPFQVKALDGKVLQLPVRGRRLLINYWASWCTPCREELPLLAQFSERAGGDVDVVGIALDTPAQASLFLARTPLPFQIAVEAPGPADSSVRFGNSRGVLPFSVLVDADGRLRKQRFGPFASFEDLQRWAGSTD